MHICSKKHWLALVLEIECPPVHHPGTVSSEYYLLIDNGDDVDNDDFVDVMVRILLANVTWKRP